MKIKNLNKKFWQLGLILLGVVAITIFTLILVFKKEETSTVKVGEKGSTKDVVDKSLSWIDSQRDTTDGLYFISARCMTENKCKDLTKTVKSWREEPYLIWGRFKNYEKTKDVGQLKKIESDLQALKLKPLQMNSWSCKLMQELVLSKILPGQDKDLAQDICILGGYEGLEEFILTDDKTLVQVMSDITENKKVDVENFNKADLASLFARNTFVSADYMAVYNTKAYYNLGLGDGKSIPVETMAKNNFLKALYGYSLMTKKDRTVYNNSILAISALDLYQFTHKKGYLDFALYLESNNKIDDSSELKDVAYHAFFVKELSTIFGQESFKEVYRLDVDRLINKKFDGKGYAGNTFDKGAFSDKSSGDYNTYLNGLVVGLLCDQL